LLHKLFHRKREKIFKGSSLEILERQDFTPLFSGFRAACVGPLGGSDFCELLCFGKLRETVPGELRLAAEDFFKGRKVTFRSDSTPFPEAGQFLREEICMEIACRFFDLKSELRNRVRRSP